MRSKRKDVNKYVFKAVEEQREEHEDSLQRSSGIKPFQLVKVRQGQRSSFDLTHTNNEILHRRAGSNNLYSEEKEIRMDLIIRQKLIVDAQANQKLESERKNIVVVSRQPADEPPVQPAASPAQQSTEEGVACPETQQEAYCIQPSHRPDPTQESPADSTSKRKRSKCPCCLQLAPEINAIISHKDQENLFSVETEEKESLEGARAEAVREAEEAMKEVKAMKQRAQPPFSFTSTKWRSKSEILQVDKWKERYGKDMLLTQKIQTFQKMAATRHEKLQAKRPYPASVETQKSSLPILHKSKQLESKPKIFKHSPSKRDEREFVKISNPEGDSYMLLTKDSLIRKESGRRAKRELEEKIEITIKKMYETEEKVEQPVQEEKEEPPEEPPEKPKRKKSKFPEIQISTFYSTKEQLDERKRTRLENIQRLAREWRFNPPKKVYLEKIMEEIPERWEYGESRESSREVDAYLQHQQQQRRLEEELQACQTEENYLCNAEVVVRQ